MEKEVNIKIEGKEWEEALDKAFEKANKKAKIDGFRPGHAPKEVFLKKYGKESLYMDAADLVLDKAYTQMLEENKDLEIVARPEMGVKSIDEKGIEFVFTLTTRPEVKLGKYTNLGIKKDEVKVTKEEIDHEIEHMRSHYAESVIKDGAISNGDTAVIDFEGFKDGVAFDGGKATNYSLEIGSNSFIPGFEEQLIGMKKDDEKEIEVTFPEDYHSEELKGKEALFKVKINSIKEKQLPELDDEFAQDVSEFDTLEEYRADIKKNLVESAEKNALVQKQNNAIDALIESSNVEAPESMINEEVDKAFRDFAGRIRQYNMDLDNYFKMLNTTEEAVREQLRPEATKRANAELVIDAFAKLENIEVSEEEIDKEIDEFGKNMKVKDFEEFKKELKSGEGLEGITASLIRRKAVDHLVSLVKFQEPKKETVEE